jgi:Family of unknown function (DUF5335)
MRRKLMHPEFGVDRHGFMPCSHPNPIDPAEYRGDRASSGEGMPHGPEIRGLAPERSAASPDRIIQVAPNDWRRRFDQLSRSHAGWLATLSVSGPEAICQAEARDIPFGGVVLEPRGAGIWIRLASLGHHIANPAAVWFRIGSDGAEKALGIETADGTRTVLEFRSALPPEMVDGIAPLPPSA